MGTEPFFKSLSLSGTYQKVSDSRLIMNATFFVAAGNAAAATLQLDEDSEHVVPVGAFFFLENIDLSRIAVKGTDSDVVFVAAYVPPA